MVKVVGLLLLANNLTYHLSGPSERYVLHWLKGDVARDHRKQRVDDQVVRHLKC